MAAVGFPSFRPPISSLSTGSSTGSEGEFASASEGPATVDPAAGLVSLGQADDGAGPAVRGVTSGRLVADGWATRIPLGAPTGAAIVPAEEEEEEEWHSPCHERARSGVPAEP